MQGKAVHLLTQDGFSPASTRSIYSVIYSGIALIVIKASNASGLVEEKLPNHLLYTVSICFER